MKLIFWGGILFFALSIYLIVANYDTIKIDQEGIIVKMRIEKLSNSCSETKIKHYATLSYGNERFVKMIHGKFCADHHVGDIVDVKYIKGLPTVLFPNESAMSNLIVFGIIGILGIAASLSQLKKLSK